LKIGQFCLETVHPFYGCKLLILYISKAKGY
jgi:hypothetical protein